jgi:hypothetical protein
MRTFEAGTAVGQHEPAISNPSSVRLLFVGHVIGYLVPAGADLPRQPRRPTGRPDPRGLNYQIEHHLFPSMPRLNLRHSRQFVRQFRREHGLPYTQTSLLDSYAQTPRYLNAVGRHPQTGTS